MSSIKLKSGFSNTKLIDILKSILLIISDTDNFILTIQTEDTTFWKRYGIEAKFIRDGSIESYGVRAQHSM